MILLWFPRWVLNLNQDVMWEVPLRGRSVISFRHLGTFLLFHLHFFSFIYLVNFIPHHHLLYLSSYLHICSSPSPFTCHPLYILSALNLRAKPWKIQKYQFLSMGLWGHLEWHGATHSDIREPKVPFSAKMTKMPLVNPKLTKGQTRSKSSQNKIFHGFISNPSSSKIFGNFDQVWPGVDSRWAPKTLILIWLLEQVKTNAIAKIIKFSFQRLFMGQNRS